VCGSGVRRGDARRLWGCTTPVEAARGGSGVGWAVDRSVSHDSVGEVRGRVPRGDSSGDGGRSSGSGARASGEAAPAWERAAEGSRCMWKFHRTPRHIPYEFLVRQSKRVTVASWTMLFRITDRAAGLFLCRCTAKKASRSGYRLCCGRCNTLFVCASVFKFLEKLSDC
jgi:hypothetical protein